METPSPANSGNNCESCQQLREELSGFKKEHAYYSDLKKKIALTDALIRRYSNKCQFDLQQKKVEELTHKLASSKRDCILLEEQLAKTLKEIIPWKREKVKFMEEYENNKRKLTVAQDALMANQSGSRQYRIQINEMEKNLATIKQEATEAKSKVKNLEAILLKRKYNVDEHKVDLAQVKREKRVMATSFEKAKGTVLRLRNLLVKHNVSIPRISKYFLPQGTANIQLDEDDSSDASMESVGDVHNGDKTQDLITPYSRKIHDILNKKGDASLPASCQGSLTEKKQESNFSSDDNVSGSEMMSHFADEIDAQLNLTGSEDDTEKTFMRSPGETAIKHDKSGCVAPKLQKGRNLKVVDRIKELSSPTRITKVNERQWGRQQAQIVKPVQGTSRYKESSNRGSSSSRKDVDIKDIRIEQLRNDNPPLKQLKEKSTKYDNDLSKNQATASRTTIRSQSQSGEDCTEKLSESKLKESATKRIKGTKDKEKVSSPRRKSQVGKRSVKTLSSKARQLTKKVKSSTESETSDEEDRSRRSSPRTRSHSHSGQSGADKTPINKSKVFFKKRSKSTVCLSDSSNDDSTRPGNEKHAGRKKERLLTKKEEHNVRKGNVKISLSDTSDDDWEPIEKDVSITRQRNCSDQKILSSETCNQKMMDQDQKTPSPKILTRQRRKTDTEIEVKRYPMRSHRLPARFLNETNRNKTEFRDIYSDGDKPLDVSLFDTVNALKKGVKKTKRLYDSSKDSSDEQNKSLKQCSSTSTQKRVVESREVDFRRKVPPGKDSDKENPAREVLLGKDLENSDLRKVSLLAKDLENKDSSKKELLTNNPGNSMREEPSEKNLENENLTKEVLSKKDPEKRDSVKEVLSGKDPEKENLMREVLSKKDPEQEDSVRKNGDSVSEIPLSRDFQHEGASGEVLLGKDSKIGEPMRELPSEKNPEKRVPVREVLSGTDSEYEDRTRAESCVKDPEGVNSKREVPPRKDPENANPAKNIPSETGPENRYPTRAVPSGKVQENGDPMRKELIGKHSDNGNPMKDALSRKDPKSRHPSIEANGDIFKLTTKETSLSSLAGGVPLYTRFTRSQSLSDSNDDNKANQEIIQPVKAENLMLTCKDSEFDKKFLKPISPVRSSPRRRRKSSGSEDESVFKDAKHNPFFQERNTRCTVPQNFSTVFSSPRRNSASSEKSNQDLNRNETRNLLSSRMHTRSCTKINANINRSCNKLASGVQTRSHSQNSDSDGSETKTDTKKAGRNLKRPSNSQRQLETTGLEAGKGVPATSTKLTRSTSNVGCTSKSSAEVCKSNEDTNSMITKTTQAKSEDSGIKTELVHFAEPIPTRSFNSRRRTRSTTSTTSSTSDISSQSDFSDQISVEADNESNGNKHAPRRNRTMSARGHKDRPVRITRSLSEPRKTDLAQIKCDFVGQPMVKMKSVPEPVPAKRVTRLNAIKSDSENHTCQGEKTQNENSNTRNKKRAKDKLIKEDENRKSMFFKRARTQSCKEDAGENVDGNRNMIIKPQRVEYEEAHASETGQTDNGVNSVAASKIRETKPCEVKKQAVNPNVKAESSRANTPPCVPNRAVSLLGRRSSNIAIPAPFQNYSPQGERVSPLGELFEEREPHRHMLPVSPLIEPFQNFDGERSLSPLPISPSETPPLVERPLSALSLPDIPPLPPLVTPLPPSPIRSNMHRSTSTSRLASNVRMVSPLVTPPPVPRAISPLPNPPMPDVISPLKDSESTDSVQRHNLIPSPRNFHAVAPIHALAVPPHPMGYSFQAARCLTANFANNERDVAGPSGLNDRNKSNDCVPSLDVNNDIIQKVDDRIMSVNDNNNLNEIQQKPVELAEVNNEDNIGITNCIAQYNDVKDVLDTEELKENEVGIQAGRRKTNANDHELENVQKCKKTNVADHQATCDIDDRQRNAARDNINYSELPAASVSKKASEAHKAETNVLLQKLSEISQGNNSDAATDISIDNALVKKENSGARLVNETGKRKRGRPRKVKQLNQDNTKESPVVDSAKQISTTDGRSDRSLSGQSPVVTRRRGRMQIQTQSEDRVDSKDVVGAKHRKGRGVTKCGLTTEGEISEASEHVYIKLGRGKKEGSENIGVKHVLVKDTITEANSSDSRKQRLDITEKKSANPITRKRSQRNNSKDDKSKEVLKHKLSREEDNKNLSRDSHFIGSKTSPETDHPEEMSSQMSVTSNVTHKVKSKSCSNLLAPSRRTMIVIPASEMRVSGFKRSGSLCKKQVTELHKETAGSTNQKTTTHTSSAATTASSAATTTSSTVLKTTAVPTSLVASATSSVAPATSSVALATSSVALAISSVAPTSVNVSCSEAQTAPLSVISFVSPTAINLQSCGAVAATDPNAINSSAVVLAPKPDLSDVKTSALSTEHDKKVLIPHTPVPYDKMNTSAQRPAATVCTQNPTSKIGNLWGDIAKKQTLSEKVMIKEAQELKQTTMYHNLRTKGRNCPASPDKQRNILERESSRGEYIPLQKGGVASAWGDMASKGEDQQEICRKRRKKALADKTAAKQQKVKASDIPGTSVPPLPKPAHQPLDNMVHVQQTLDRIAKYENGTYASELIKRIVSNFQFNSLDLLPVVYARCLAGNTSTQPVLGPIEEMLITAVMDWTKNNDSTTLVDLLLPSLRRAMDTLKTSKKGGQKKQFALHSTLCRAYTLFCLHTNNLQCARVFAYEIVHNNYPDMEKLVLSIAASWPAVLRKQKSVQASPVGCVIEFVVMRGLQVKVAEDIMIKQTQAALASICGWKTSGVTTVANITQQLAGMIEDVNIAHLTDESDLNPTLGQMAFELTKAIELLAHSLSWKWTNDMLIREHLWPVLKKWSVGLQSDNGINNGSACVVMKIIANVGVHGLRDNKHSVSEVMKMLLAVLQQPSSMIPWCVQLFTADAILQLSASKPSQSCTILQNWCSNAIQTVPTSLSERIQVLATWLSNEDLGLSESDT